MTRHRHRRSGRRRRRRASGCCSTALPAAADQGYHTQPSRSPPWLGAPGAATVTNIHTKGPVNYGIERYQLRGATPRTTYEVARRSIHGDADCRAEPGLQLRDRVISRRTAWATACGERSVLRRRPSHRSSPSAAVLNGQVDLRTGVGEGAPWRTTRTASRSGRRPAGRARRRRRALRCRRGDEGAGGVRPARAPGRRLVAARLRDARPCRPSCSCTAASGARRWDLGARGRRRRRPRRAGVPRLERRLPARRASRGRRRSPTSRPRTTTCAPAPASTSRARPSSATRPAATWRCGWPRGRGCRRAHRALRRTCRRRRWRSRRRRSPTWPRRRGSASARAPWRRCSAASPPSVPDRLAVADPLGLLPTGVPTVCVHGEADEDVPIAQSEAYVARAGAAARLVRLPGGHMQHVDPASAAGDALREALRVL